MPYLYDELVRYCGSDAYPFHMPGHKRRLGQLNDPFSFDITEIDGFDNLHHAEGILLEAEKRAARLYGAEETHFLVNGSTAGILSAIGAATTAGGRLLMMRASHKAAYHAAAAGGLFALAPALAPNVAAPGALAARFRLAGTILGASTGGAEEPMAIIDDRELVRQHVTTRSEEVVPGIVLRAVGPDFATLAGPDGEETLRLSRPAAAARAPRQEAAKDRSAAASAPGRPRTREEAAERFGGREVFPDRWQFDRDKVVAYYEELRSQPERLLAVFDSMDPVYVEDPDGESRIEG